jgi:hypothetical protein
MNIPVPYISKGNAVHNIVEGQTGVPFPAGLQSTEETNDNDNSDNLQSVTPVDEGLQNTNEGGN